MGADGECMPLLREQRGFTLTEVMCASLVLIVGILGTATLGDTANRLSVQADQRSGANSVARRVSEAARGLTTTQLTGATVLSELKIATPTLPDATPGNADWSVNQRGAVYTVAATVCTVDSPADGYSAAAARDATYCTQPIATQPADLQPDDYRRVTIAVSLNGTAIARQFTDMPSGTTSSLPLITDLRMRQPGLSCSTACPAILSTAQTTAVFDATTVNNPSLVDWTIDGRSAVACPPIGVACTGAGDAWTFNWALGTVATDTTSGSRNLGFCVPGDYVLDGSYRVGPQAFDRNGATGGGASLSITVNRCVGGLAPPGLDATGRNGNGPVDIDWQNGPEGDTIGYRVYRETAGAGRRPVCPPVITAGQVTPLDAANECLDVDAPAYSSTPLHYGVYPVDRDSAGVLREGAVSYVNVNSGNRAPNAVTNVMAGRTAGAVTLTWTLPNARDPDSGDSIESLRVYRRTGATLTAPALTSRYDRELTTALCTGTACRWVDPAPLTSATTYWVTSVDTHLRESPFSAGEAT